MDCKKLLFEKMEAFLEPIRNKRRELENDPDTVRDILHRGNEAARSEAEATMERVRSRMSLV
jgi:tryptophanyl-tRNA synthetase